MGNGYDLMCGSCDYNVSIMEGIGMMYYRENVFPEVIPRYSIEDMDDELPLDYWMNHGERKPLLFELVRSKAILKKTVELLQMGASVGEYGHALYDCPKCHRLTERFHFELRLGDEVYEPDYKCSRCRKLLKRTELDIDDNDVARIVYVDGSDADWHCPQCGGDALEFFGGFILWD